ncbi:MAG: aspartate kinase [Akkermansia sp.]|nr:aspartate kinase [Clostridia bacterium]MBR1998788.1 aspartate kinase [Akkermansia sp.]MBR3695233.1 aspartate kinase [Akkermansia sp.]MBR3945136.1 aspartate kinase [Akkermansia sp.]MBR7109511.1 aspartate kinase [Akkermansia sp.]
MALIVQKYGGSSVGTIDRIRNVARRLIETKNAGNKVVAVISAMSGVTDKLIALAHEVMDNPPERELDMLMATGEQQSIALLCMAITDMGYKARSFTGAQAGVCTYGSHTRGRIDNIQPEKVLQALDEDCIVVCAGFQGVTKDGTIHTLGRGGSDLSAIAMAAAVKADLCQIYTDVDGVYTCDPRVVKDARKIPVLSYEEMLEMASSGSKVMQARSVEFAKKFGVVFEVRNSMNSNPGTIVQEENSAMESLVVRGVSIERNQARVTVSGITAPVAYTALILSALAKAEINVDMIVANTAHDGQARQSFTMNMNDLGAAQAALKTVLPKLGPTAKLETEAGLAKLSVVGVGMRSNPGVAATVFQTLADAGIQTGMIATSEIRITTTVDAADIEMAARVVHAAFNLDQVSA